MLHALLGNKKYRYFFVKIFLLLSDISGDMLPWVKEWYRSRCRFRGNYYLSFEYSFSDVQAILECKYLGSSWMGKSKVHDNKLGQSYRFKIHDIQNKCQR